MNAASVPVGLEALGEKKIAKTLETVYFIDEEINHLKREISRLTEMKNEIIESHIKRDVLEEGDFRIQRTERQVRNLNVAEFIRRYPEAANKLVRNVVSVTEADKEIGKNNVTALCAVETIVSYKVDYISGKVNLE